MVWSDGAATVEILSDRVSGRNYAKDGCSGKIRATYDEWNLLQIRVQHLFISCGRSTGLGSDAFVIVYFRLGFSSLGGRYSVDIAGEDLMVG